MRTNRFAALLAVALVVAVAGAVGYQIGVSHGLALGGQLAAFPPNAVPPIGWYRPWGFGVGFLFPFLFLAFWFVILRALFWGGPWRRGWHHAGACGVSSSFDEWHRRAHERMKTEPSPQTNA
jgi:hypothetical protein